VPPHTPLRTPLAPPHTMLIVCVCVDTLSFYKQRNPATSRVLLFAQMRAGAIAGPSVFFLGLGPGRSRWLISPGKLASHS